MPKISSVDYSFNSPGITTVEFTSLPNILKFVDCHSYFYTTKKKFAKDFGSNIHGSLQKEWGCPEQRFDQLSDWAMQIINGSTFVYIEGYSYGSHGKIFEIAENTAVLKYKLYKASIPIQVISPMSIKKNATSKGNSDKTAMIDVFCKTQIDIRKVLDCGDVSPMSDVVDSYFLLAAGISQLKTA